MSWHLQKRFLETAIYLECLLIIRIVTTAVTVAAAAITPNMIPTMAPVLKPELEELGKSVSRIYQNQLQQGY